jgi:hypothetical protein
MRKNFVRAEVCPSNALGNVLANVLIAAGIVLFTRVSSAQLR